MNESLMHAIIFLAARLSGVTPRPTAKQLRVIAMGFVRDHQLSQREGVALLEAAGLLAAPLEDDSDIEASAYESIECSNLERLAEAEGLDHRARQIRKVLQLLEPPARGSSTNLPTLRLPRGPLPSTEQLLDPCVATKRKDRSIDCGPGMPDNPELYNYSDIGTSPGVSINGPAGNHPCRSPARPPRSSPAGSSSNPRKGSLFWLNFRKRTTHE